MLLTLTLENEEEINDIIKDVGTKDVHTSTKYMRLFQDYLGWKAYYAIGDETYLPFFLRPIPNTDCFDIVGPWYFGGVMSNKENINPFLEEFHSWCIDHNVVSEFHRLNPIMENHKFYPEQNVFFDRKIVYVDLSKSLETLKSEYDRHAKKNIKKAEREGLTVVNSFSHENKQEFVELYTKNMRDKETGRFYFFNKTFYDTLFKDFDVKLFNVRFGGEIICSSLELGGGDILYDYLRGTNHSTLNHRPNDLVLDSVIMWAKNQGYKYFVIGGGNTTDPEDGQLRFKKSFSSTTKPFFVYKKIHNKETYDELCKEKGIVDLKFEEAGYFPEYTR